MPAIKMANVPIYDLRHELNAQSTTFDAKINFGIPILSFRSLRYISGNSGTLQRGELILKII